MTHIATTNREHHCPMFSTDRAERIESSLQTLVDRQQEYGKSLAETRKHVELYLGNGRPGEVLRQMDELRDALMRMTFLVNEQHESIATMKTVSDTMRDDVERHDQQCRECKIDVVTDAVKRLETIEQQFKWAAGIVGAITFVLGVATSNTAWLQRLIGTKQ